MYIHHHDVCIKHVYNLYVYRVTAEYSSIGMAHDVYSQNIIVYIVH